MFGVVKMYEGKRAGMKVHFEKEDNELPFALEFKLGKTEMRVYMSAQDAEQLWAEINSGLQEHDRVKFDAQLKSMTDGKL